MRLLTVIIWRQFASRFGRRNAYLMVFHDASHELLDRVDVIVRDGKVRPYIASIYPADVPNIVAASASREGREVGKLIIERGKIS